jgi:inhibitor of cysteine peptidase
MAMATIIATPSNNGGSLQAHVGDELVVRLPETPSTGYRWTVDVSPVNATLDHDSFDPAKGGGVGGQGTRTFEFRVTASGDAHLGLKRWRAWEGDKSVAERYRVTLHVR